MDTANCTRDTTIWHKLPQSRALSIQVVGLGGLFLRSGVFAYTSCGAGTVAVPLHGAQDGIHGALVRWSKWVELQVLRGHPADTGDTQRARLLVGTDLRIV